MHVTSSNRTPGQASSLFTIMPPASASSYAVAFCIQCTLLTTSSTPYFYMYLFMYIHNDSRVSTGGQQEDKKKTTPLS